MAVYPPPTSTSSTRLGSAASSHPAHARLGHCTPAIHCTLGIHCTHHQAQRPPRCVPLTQAYPRVPPPLNPARAKAYPRPLYAPMWWQASARARDVLRHGQSY
eukprot:scaffold122051_cov66-Phaeocystis_antarctica.AAC.1